MQIRVEISIHAPARGATNWVNGAPPKWDISIHAPARGATIGCHISITSFINISIHAPARGATSTGLRLHALSLFQSTHPHGVRLDLLWIVQSLRVISIHAPARGATSCKSRHLISSNFNPRTRTGCDAMIKQSAIAPLISIHAPARGATVGVFITHSNHRISIHAPARGATPERLGTIPCILEFQSTHPHGVRQ